MISYHGILLIRNHMIFLMQCGINKHLLIVSKTTNRTRRTGLLVFDKIYSCYLFQTAFEIMWYLYKYFALNTLFSFDNLAVIVYVLHCSARKGDDRRVLCDIQLLIALAPPQKKQKQPFYVVA